MREIKFRAWDKKANHMVCWKDISRTNILGMLVNNNNRDDSRVILMQFTGLLDKQGVEIYEGDILHMGDIRIKYVVEWIDTGLKARQIGNKSTAGIEYHQKWIEVIGNIYEHGFLLDNNPELLDIKCS